MSLMTVNRESADFFTRPGIHAGVGVSSVSSSQSVMPDDAIHGGADLMAHVGQKFALGPAGRLSDSWRSATLAG